MVKYMSRKCTILTISKRTVQWHWHTHVALHPSPPSVIVSNWNCAHSTHNAPFPPPSAPGNRYPLFCLRAFDCCRPPRRSGVAQCLCFCDWLISRRMLSARAMHLAARVRISFPSETEWSSPACRYCVSFIHSSIRAFGVGPAAFWLPCVTLWIWVSAYLFESLLPLLWCCMFNFLRNHLTDFCCNTLSS